MAFVKLLACGCLGLGLIAVPAIAQDVSPAEKMVDGLNAIFGKHKGARGSHAKGLCATGSFTGTKDGPSVSKAGFLSGKEAPAVIRLSMGGGNPKISDKAKTAARGMALKITADDGDAEMVLSSAPMFGARTVEQFIGFLEARKPDPATGKPDLEKIKAFTAANPETGRLGAFFNSKPVPASYAQTAFFGVNTFFFTNAQGERRPGRWTIVPVAGEAGLNEEELKSKADNFYTEELAGRLAANPVEFDFYVQFPESSDDLLDATSPWPDSRAKTLVGRLSVKAISSGDAAAECDQAVYDPIIMPDGVEPSDDPILQARSAAYAVSLSRRSE